MAAEPLSAPDWLALRERPEGFHHRMRRSRRRHARRGRAAARDAGVEGCLRSVAGDVNRRLADGRCDAVIANQSLHHMLELENTFNEIARVLGRDANAGRDAECRHRAGVSPRSALRIA